ncbi:VOC family protein [Mycolicibacterium moriokaense]|nr:VOC family protein [Mycolicibacterium moriokaense]
MRIRWSGLTIDCADPARLATFWGALLDREARPGLPGWVELAPRHEKEPRINLQPVPEPKSGKVRIHLDIAVDDIDSMVERIISLGGRDTGERHEYPEGVVIVLADPEGNEFCAVQYYD